MICRKSILRAGSDVGRFLGPWAPMGLAWGLISEATSRLRFPKLALEASFKIRSSLKLLLTNLGDYKNLVTVQRFTPNTTKNINNMNFWEYFISKTGQKIYVDYLPSDKHLKCVLVHNHNLDNMSTLSHYHVEQKYREVALPGYKLDSIDYMEYGVLAESKGKNWSDTLGGLKKMAVNWARTDSFDDCQIHINSPAANTGRSAPNELTRFCAKIDKYYDKIFRPSQEDVRNYNIQKGKKCGSEKIENCLNLISFNQKEVEEIKLEQGKIAAANNFSQSAIKNSWQIPIRLFHMLNKAKGKPVFTFLYKSQFEYYSPVIFGANKFFEASNLFKIASPFS